MLHHEGRRPGNKEPPVKPVKKEVVKKNNNDSNPNHRPLIPKITEAREDNSDNILEVENSYIPKEFFVIEENAVRPPLHLNEQSFISTHRAPRINSANTAPSTWETIVFPSLTPSRREEVLFLQNALRKMIKSVKPTVDGIDYSMNEWKVYNIVWHELIRQVNTYSKDRGALLREIRSRVDDIFKRLLKDAVSSRDAYFSYVEETKILKSMNLRLTQSLDDAKTRTQELNIQLAAALEQNQRLEHAAVSEVAVAPSVVESPSTTYTTPEENWLYLKNLQASHTAAQVLQRSWRHYRNECKLRIENRKALRKVAAITLQRWMKQLLRRKKQYKVYENLKIVAQRQLETFYATRIQRFYRQRIIKNHIFKRNDSSIAPRRSSVVVVAQPPPVGSQSKKQRKSGISKTNSMTFTGRSKVSFASGKRLEAIKTSIQNLASSISSQLSPSDRDNTSQKRSSLLVMMVQNRTVGHIDLEKMVQSIDTELQKLSVLVTQLKAVAALENPRANAAPKLQQVISTATAAVAEAAVIKSESVRVAEESIKDENENKPSKSLFSKVAVVSNKSLRKQHATTTNTTDRTKSITWLKPMMHDILLYFASKVKEEVSTVAQKTGVNMNLRYTLSCTMAEWNDKVTALHINYGKLTYRYFQTLFGLRARVVQTLSDLVTTVNNVSSTYPDVKWFSAFLNETKSKEELLLYLHLWSKVTTTSLGFLKHQYHDVISLEVARKLSQEVFRLKHESDIVSANPELFSGQFEKYLPTQVYNQFDSLLSRHVEILGNDVPVPPALEKQGQGRRSSSNTLRKSSLKVSSKGQPRILFTDYMALLDTFVAEHRLRYLRFQWIRSVFVSADFNHDEFISQAEFVKALGKCYPPPSRRDLCLIYKNAMRSTAEMSYRLFLKTVCMMIQNGLVSTYTIDLMENDESKLELRSDPEVLESISVMREVATKWSEKQGSVEAYVATMQRNGDSKSLHTASTLANLETELQRVLLQQNLTKEAQLKASSDAVEALKSIMCILLVNKNNTTGRRDSSTTKNQLDALKVLDQI